LLSGCIINDTIALYSYDEIFLLAFRWIQEGGSELPFREVVAEYFADEKLSLDTLHRFYRNSQLASEKQRFCQIT
jgi:hypothetical protein